MAHTVKVLKVSQLNPLPHSQGKGRSAETVDQHPNVSGIQSRDLFSRTGTTLKGMLDIGPRSNNRAENHETKREKRQTGN